MPDPRTPTRAPTSSPPLSAAVLSRGAAAMLEDQDHRGLICLVEAWDDLSEVPALYRIAQIRALLSLCQTDRAWIRLKPLVEVDEPDPEALKLAVRMFIQRGWPQRAQEPLALAQALSPDDPELAELVALAERPAASVSEPDSDGDDHHALVRFAAEQISRGNRLRGQAVLERVRRAHPDDARTRDLLWAMESDYTLSPAVLGSLSAIDASRPPDDDPGQTEVALLPPDDTEDEPADFGFPALFRDTSNTEGKRADTPVSPPRQSLDEVTQSTNLADLEQLREAVGAARRSAGFVTQQEFTEIRRIIRRPDGSADVGSSVGSATIPDSPFDDTTGFTRRPVSANHQVDIEAEDDALIIVTKRETADDHGADLELDPNTEAVAHPDAARFLAEAEAIARQEALDADQARRRADRDRRIADAKVEKTSPRSRRPSHLPLAWLLAIGVLGAAAAGLFVLVLVLYGVL